jgi:predicted permease
MYILNVLAPVFLVIALGAVLRRTGFVSDEILGGMSRLAYWVGLPCLLIHKLAGASFDGAGSFDTFWLVFIGMIASVIVGGAVALAMRMSRDQIGAFIQASFRGNLAFVGLAVIMSAFSALPGGGAGDLARAERAAVLTFGPIVPIYNIAAVLVLLAFRHKLSIGSLRTMLLQVASNPLLIACVIGVSVSLSGWSLGGPINRTLEILGRFALPLALLCVGGKIAATKLAGNIRLPALAAIIKLSVGPVVGYFAAGWLGVGRVETAVALIMLACPTAVASYVLTEQLGGDSALSAGAVVVSTILSIASLAAVVAMI